MFCSFTDIRDSFGRYDFQKKKKSAQRVSGIIEKVSKTLLGNTG